MTIFGIFTSNGGYTQTLTGYFVRVTQQYNVSIDSKYIYSGDPSETRNEFRANLSKSELVVLIESLKRLYDTGENT